MSKALHWPIISDGDVYVIDLFRVVGGSQHDKLFHSHFGEIMTQGLALTPADDYGHDTQMRNSRVDPTLPTGWSRDWKIYDRLGLLPPDADRHLRYTDLTAEIQTFTTEGWVWLCSGYQVTKHGFHAC